MARDSKPQSGAALAAAKLRLLARLRSKTAEIGSGAANEITPRPHGVVVPLSFAQERLWFLQQWEPASAVYNVARAWRLKGALDVALLARCVEVILQRHEVLRTVFANDGDRPMQQVLTVAAPALEIFDLRHIARSLRNEEISRRVAAEAGHCFNLAAEPLLRVALLKLDRQDHVFVFVAHQAVCDGRSLDLFYRELEGLYANSGAVEAASLAELPVQYGDYALWQRRALDDAALAVPLAYWKKQLGGVLPVLDLTADKPWAAAASVKGARQKIILDKTLTAGLKKLSARASNTLFVTLMAAFNVLLWRYTRQNDLVVGFPVANRDHPALENLIGSFVNTLALRSDLSRDPTFNQLLARLRANLQEALAHQELPFERLVDELKQARDSSRTAIFQTLFTFQNRLPAALSLGAIRSEPIDCDGGGAKYDLSLALGEAGGRLSGFLEYRRSLFADDTIARMLQHFLGLLKAIVANPDRPIARLPMLSERENRSLLVEWNQTRAVLPMACAHQLFEAQAQRTPSAVALECGAARLTYDQLNRRVNRLARYLKNLPAGRNCIVALCLERSVDMVVGLLAVLKAGAAYLPLDPEYPRERLEFILDDAQVSVLISQKSIADDRGWKMDDSDRRSSILHSRPHLILLDRERRNIETHSSDNIKRGSSPRDLAYVIYTSGSTGVPKGVEIEHRSLANCLHAMRRQLSLGPRDVWLAVTTISFDIAGAEIFLPLITGGKLVVVSRDEARDGERLAQRLKVSAVTAMQATPSTWRLLLEAGWQGKAEFKILCGGETLPRELADPLSVCGQLWNLYGPTETTIWSTMHRVDGACDTVPIGRPLANTQLYILDGALQPVPVGIVGELYIGGAGVARGYCKRPELTAERFIANPFSRETSARIYRTGDLARYQTDGTVEFLGRADNQVKLRGFRIELGEIESVLRQHPSVHDAVVVPYAIVDNRASELVGYWVSRDGEKLAGNDLRAYLTAKLPYYMVPSTLVFLAALPLTPNGKVDRRALPVPDGYRANSALEFSEPRDDIEELVAQVWREVLKLERLGVHENFFQLGGHSLLATRVVARLRGSFNVDLALRKIFERPTVAGLAEEISLLRRNQPGTGMVPMARVARDRAMPLSFSQRRLWFLQKVDGDLAAYYIPAVFRIDGELDGAALAQALNRLTARHEALRTVIREVAGEPCQEIAAELQVALPVTDMSGLPADAAEAEWRRLAAIDARAVYDLARAPLWRAQLVKLAQPAHVLILNFHHMIADGSSLAIFYRELASSYESCRRKEVAFIAPLPLQYADYACWQQRWLDSPACVAQLDYWKRNLTGLAAPVSIPTDFARPAARSYRGAKMARRLPGELAAAMSRFNRQHGVTSFMTLFAAFSVLLSRLGGQADVVVGSTVAGRNRAEMEGVIGFFINALPLRVDLADNPSFVGLLTRIREICLDAYSNQELPFEKLVEEVNPAHDPSRNPLFDILFNVADASERRFSLADCKIDKIIESAPGAKFDLVLSAPEVGGSVELAVVYNAELYCPERIATLLEQFELILAQAVRSPELAIDEISLLGETAQSSLPDPTAMLDDRWEGAIHELVAQQARHVPGKAALIQGGESWNYAEIDLAAARLSSALRAGGVAPKDVVAIYAQRDAALVVALLGILKAGAAFLILDPAYPAARSLDYVKIARPKAWIQLDGGAELAPELAGCLTALGVKFRIALPHGKSAIVAALAHYQRGRASVLVAANDPAYIAFTSGSTGEPKGVLCGHGPMTHFLPWQRDAFELRESDRFAVLSGLAYSHLHRDVFTALAVGGTVYIPDDSTARAPDSLANWLDKNRITVLHLTPALGQLLLAGGERSLAAVRRIFFGGDVLTSDDVRRMHRLAPNAVIGSFYGATETQRAVGYYEIGGEILDAANNPARPVPLGRGIKDVQLLVLNRRQQLCGIGELGELYVRSPHLALGYVDDDERSAARFIVNPFTGNECDRLYRTGELGRYRPNGNVEWAGRSDRRVNIRGFRVELAEIEAALKQHPTVMDAAVIAKDFPTAESDNPKSQIQNPKFDKRLVAYIVASEEGESEIDLLRSYLTAELPDYMVPGYFVILERLPLVPNGKLNYDALPQVTESFTESSASILAPRTEVEAKLCEIFTEVLGRERIGVEDNFFRLGGHSLLAAQAAVRIKNALGVGLDLRAFLAAPTVAALARSLASSNVNLVPPIGGEREEIEI